MVMKQAKRNPPDINKREKNKNGKINPQELGVSAGVIKRRIKYSQIGEVPTRPTQKQSFKVVAIPSIGPKMTSSLLDTVFSMIICSPGGIKQVPFLISVTTGVVDAKDVWGESVKD